LLLFGFINLRTQFTRQKLEIKKINKKLVIKSSLTFLLKKKIIPVTTLFFSGVASFQALPVETVFGIIKRKFCREI